MTSARLDDNVIDEIAVERCLAGTLRAQHLTSPERDQVVSRLFQLGYSNPEIVQRTGVALADIKSTLIRLGLLPHKECRLALSTPGTCTQDQAHRARRTVAAHANDADEAESLLLALGLIEQAPVWTSLPSDSRQPTTTPNRRR